MSTRPSSAKSPTSEPGLPQEFLKYANPRRFFALALGMSWTFWIPIALFDLAPFSMPGVVLFAVGGLGPAAAELALIVRAADPAYRRDYVQRVVDVRRIGPRWLAVVLLFFPVVTAVAFAVEYATTGTLPAFETAARFAANPLSLLPYAVFILLFGPLPEELGWRGYALDGLQARWSALVASLLLGVGWAAWHLPMFFMEGTFQHELGVLTPMFALFNGGIVVSSVLYTWIYNNTNRSTLSAILFHFTTNFTGEVTGLDGQARLYQFLLVALAAVVVTVAWGPATLARSPSERLSVAGAG